MSSFNDHAVARLVYQKSKWDHDYLSCISILIFTRLQNLPRNVSKVAIKASLGKLRKVTYMKECVKTRKKSTEQLPSTPQKVLSSTLQDHHPQKNSLTVRTGKRKIVK